MDKCCCQHDVDDHFRAFRECRIPGCDCEIYHNFTGAFHPYAHQQGVSK